MYLPTDCLIDARGVRNYSGEIRHFDNRILAIEMTTTSEGQMVIRWLSGTSKCAAL